VVLALSIIAVIATYQAVTGPLAGDAFSEQSPVYVRLEVSPVASFYLEFSEREMRLARSPEEIADAAPVSKTERRDPFVAFTEVVLPLEPSELPDGCSELRATFELYWSGGSLWGRRRGRGECFCVATPGYVLEAGDGSRWTYWLRMGFVNPETSPSDAPVYHVASLTEPRAEVTAEVDEDEEDEVGIAIVLDMGDWRFGDIQENGESVQASLQVVDESGKIVASAQGTLDELGFT
jgi:hypothetical protein